MSNRTETAPSIQNNTTTTFSSGTAVTSVSTQPGRPHFVPTATNVGTTTTTSTARQPPSPIADPFLLCNSRHFITVVTVPLTSNSTGDQHQIPPRLPLFPTGIPFNFSTQFSMNEPTSDRQSRPRASWRVNTGSFTPSVQMRSRSSTGIPTTQTETHTVCFVVVSIWFLKLPNLITSFLSLLVT